ncbi:hypothetical protein ABZ484_36160 [Streptomyces sp. NPDC006393]|uniref:hypothetical protein n=1 Tax=Streptomyces sp. NPDC006393 TaxID=3156763 RepID=UPI0033F9D8A7
MTEEEYEDLRELDRLRSDNPRLNGWLESMRERFPAWNERHGGGWDFGLASLARLEELVRNVYDGSCARADADKDSDFLEVASWYLGEVHNRHYGSVWQWHPDSLAVDPPVRPFVIQPFERLEEFPDEDGIEEDGRPVYTPVERLCGFMLPGQGDLVEDTLIHVPPSDRS